MEQTTSSFRSSFKCPGCGSELHKGKFGYGCSNYKNGCKFFIKETIASKKLTYFQAERLVTRGTTGDTPISGFQKKNGQTFSAILFLDYKVENGIVTYCDIKFKFPDPRDIPTHAANASTNQMYCPACESSIVAGKWGWECENHCGFTLNYKISGKDMSRQDLFELLMRGETRVFHDFISKKGHHFSASIRLAEDKKRTEFVFVEEEISKNKRQSN